MKLAEAFAKKTYKTRSHRDVMWNRQVPVTRAQLESLRTELAYYVGLRVTLPELVRDYKKQAEQYFDYIDDAKDDFIEEHATDFYENEVGRTVKEIFGNAR